MDLDRLCQETYHLRDVLKECSAVAQSKTNCFEMSLEKLSDFYDRIDDGLISYNLIRQNCPEGFKLLGEELKKDNGRLGKFLEFQLFKVVATIVLKDPHHRMPEKFKESLWCLKIKDREYYNQMPEVLNIPPEYRDAFYNLLQKGS